MVESILKLFRNNGVGGLVKTSKVCQIWLKSRGSRFFVDCLYLVPALKPTVTIVWATHIQRLSKRFTKPDS